jgi:hypothetical protein
MNKAVRQTTFFGPFPGLYPEHVRMKDIVITNIDEYLQLSAVFDLQAAFGILQQFGRSGKTLIRIRNVAYFNPKIQGIVWS